MTSWLDPVRRALDSRTRPLALFVRDDDAGWEAPRLNRLLDLFEACALPLDLAVIPAALDATAARRLLARRAAVGGRLGLHQHGWTHHNHETTGRASEFGASRSVEAMRGDVESGRRLLLDAFGDALDPTFTPPWNRCTQVLAAILPVLGFRILSRDRTAGDAGIPGLRECPTSLDWFAKRRGVRLSAEAWTAEAATQCGTLETLGLLLHHAVMGDEDFERLGAFLALLSTHGACRPASLATCAFRMPASTDPAGCVAAGVTP